MAHKLSYLNVNPKLILWIMDFLVNLSQFVRYQKLNSAFHSTFRGAPQSTILSHKLFTLYTNDCSSGTDTNPLIKYSDNSALVDLSNSDRTYFDEVDRFVTWCKENYLDERSTLGRTLK